MLCGLTQEYFKSSQETVEVLVRYAEVMPDDLQQQAPVEILARVDGDGDDSAIAVLEEGVASALTNLPES
jgi:hypothetical protein